MASAKIPLLPGFSVNVDLKTDHKKRQIFNYKNGLPVISEMAAAPAIADEIMTNVVSDTVMYNEAKQDASLVMSQVPAWVAYDRKVLRFFGYFVESVPLSALETQRVRKVIFYFYLEDDSMHIAEERQSNSGIPQGVFLKRHRVPKSASEFFSIDDMIIGADLNVYGRHFHIYDCDPFTRAFYDSLQLSQPAAEECPKDAFAIKSSKPKPKSFGKPMHPMKTFMEAMLGKCYGKSVEETKQFLENDRKVLRFYCLWNDPSLYGEARPFVVNYFLADDCVEVCEVAQANSGRDPFPALLKKSRLPRAIGLTTAASGEEPTSASYYNVDDFHVGSTISVYGRDFYIYAVDEYTKAYLMQVKGHTERDFPEIKIESEKKEAPKCEIPPYNGYGTEEDSLGSFYSLVPKQPKKDLAKLAELENKALQFTVTLNTKKPEDINRIFSVTFYLADQSISIYEKQQRNSGFWSGKFLEKTRLKNPATGDYYQPKDFKLGQTISINSFLFNLNEADGYTTRYFAEHGL